jgi:hypothetical protein
MVPNGRCCLLVDGLSTQEVAPRACCWQATVPALAFGPRASLLGGWVVMRCRVLRAWLPFWLGPPRPAMSCGRPLSVDSYARTPGLTFYVPCFFPADHRATLLYCLSLSQSFSVRMPANSPQCFRELLLF